jgi:hypothetical protein
MPFKKNANFLSEFLICAHVGRFPSDFQRSKPIEGSFASQTF